MSTTMMLAVDTARHERGGTSPAAVELVRDLAAKTGDKVMLLHVHEYAVGRFGRVRVHCPDGDGEKLVAAVVSDLQDAGVSAEGEGREADIGHVAQAILTARPDHGARILVLGSSSRTDLPSVTLGNVASRLLHLSPQPVLIVPMHPAEPEAVKVRVHAEAAGTATA